MHNKENFNGENNTGKITSHESLIENSKIEAQENDASVILKKIGCEIKKPTTMSSIWKDGKKIVEKEYSHIILKLGLLYGVDKSLKDNEEMIILPEDLQKDLKEALSQTEK